MSVAEYLEERIAAGDFPGAVFVAHERGRETAAVARGRAVVAPERIAMTEETIFDLASLTKPLATALLVAIEAEAGRLSFDDPVAAHLAEFDREHTRHMTLGHLLTHTSGLPKWLPLYVRPGDPARVAERIASLPLAYETGTRVVYSDPN